MTYICDLNPGQRVFLDNQGEQTVLVCMSGQPGQQQQSSSSFTTGRWKQAPVLLRSSQGTFIQIQSERGNTVIQVQGNGFQVMTQQAIGQPVQTIPMQQTESMPEMPPMSNMNMPPMAEMQPMREMPPMTMGNMRMTTSPMQMNMGDMSMSMGDTPPVKTSAATNSSSSTPPSTTPQRNFCNSCGAPVQPTDRFCSSCGQKLG